MKIARYIVILMALVLAPALSSSAQNITEKGDSVVYRKSVAMDSTLVGKSIFSLLPSSEKGGAASVTVHQSKAILNALNGQIASNSSRKITGYRIRIYSDNKQNARNASEAALSRFKGMYPGISAYRTFSNPSFKVTVGDFRTKSEALQLLQQLKGSFPSAFIVSETINYPIVFKQRSYTTEVSSD